MINFPYPNEIPFNDSYEGPVKVFVREHLEKSSRPVFWDIGAHAGTVSHYVRQWVPEAFILAVEANPYTAAFYADHISGPGALVCAAAWDCDELLTITLFPHNAGITKVGPRRFAQDSAKTVNALPMDLEVLVPGITLDSLISKCPMPDVVKIDVEGADLRALRGAFHVLEHAKAVVVERDERNLADRGETVEEMDELMRRSGFSVRVEGANGYYVKS